jgi:hypothetical protein
VFALQDDSDVVGTLRDNLGSLLEGEVTQFGPDLAPNLTSAIAAIPTEFEGSKSKANGLLASLVAARTAFYRDRPAIAAEWGDGGAERVRHDLQATIRSAVDYLNTPGLPWRAATTTWSGTSPTEVLANVRAALDTV